jgi:hypothetical protein
MGVLVGGGAWRSQIVENETDRLFRNFGKKILFFAAQNFSLSPSPSPQKGQFSVAAHF